MIEPAAIHALEVTTFASWPDLAHERLGGWLLRFAAGYTKRANSVNVLEPDPDHLDARIATAEARYRAVGLRPIFRLTPLAEPELDSRLAERGYAVVEPSLVKTAPIGRTAAHRAEVIVYEGPDKHWCAAQAAAAGLDPVAAATQGAMLARVAGRLGCALVPGQSAPLAFGIAAVVDDRVGFFDILTLPQARRRGLARTVMESLTAWARDEAGAGRMWIQVVEANAPARALYRSLGFESAYSYHYRVAP